MSGHSKWSQIKHQKGSMDARRAQIFTKLSNAITISVRESGGVTEAISNPKLRMLVEKAKAANMPKENIQRAIDRGAGKLEGVQFVELVYEGFGPGGIAFIVKAATDNKNRVIANLKNHFSKFGGVLSQPGSVMYMFRNLGKISLARPDKSNDEVTEAALEAGVDDIDFSSPDCVVMYTTVEKLKEVNVKLNKIGLSVLEYELCFKPAIFQAISKKSAEFARLEELINTLREDPDIQDFWTNAEFSD